MSSPDENNDGLILFVRIVLDPLEDANGIRILLHGACAYGGSNDLVVA